MKNTLKALERALRGFALLACCLLGAGSQSYVTGTSIEATTTVTASVTEAPGPNAAGGTDPVTVEIASSHTRYRSPTADSIPRVIHPFEKPAQRWSAGHRGVDLAVPEHDRHVYAPASGKVVFSGMVVNRKVLVIAHPDGRRSTFEPMDEALPVGTEVTTGDVIGTVSSPDSAGENGEHPYRRCTTVCLYWGVRQGGTHGDGSGKDAEYINPMSLLSSRDPSILLPVPGGY